MSKSRNGQFDSFFTVLRLGLWGRDSSSLTIKERDFSSILRLSEEQLVVGLVASGFEEMNEVIISQEIALQLVGRTVQLERRNIAMNDFISSIVGEMRKNGIISVLVKGQGVAQYYEKPLWRVAGDVDFLLDNDNYEKAKEFLLQLAGRRKNEEKYSRHLGMNIGPWYVELHGSLRTGLSSRVDAVVDATQRDVLCNGAISTSLNGVEGILLPDPDNHLFFIFSHFIKHLYKGGVNFRQICDVCRLLWTYQGCINSSLLEQRLSKAGLLTEWKMFASLAVNFLGMSIEQVPLYSSLHHWRKKAALICDFILSSEHTSKLVRTCRLVMILPANTFRFMLSIFFNLNYLKIREFVRRYFNNLREDVCSFC